MTDNESESDRRYQGILTPKDRSFLRGEIELSENARRNARYRIRERIKTAFRDFELLHETLSASDRQQIFTDIAEADPETFAFIMSLFYRGMDDLAVHSDEDVASETLFEELINMAITIDEQDLQTPLAGDSELPVISPQPTSEERPDLSQGKKFSHCNDRDALNSTAHSRFYRSGNKSRSMPERWLEADLLNQNQRAKLSREWMNISSRSLQSSDRYGC